MINNMRRRLLAGLAGMGATGILTSKSLAQSDDTRIQVACRDYDNSGSLADPRPNYDITALKGDFALPASIQAFGDNVTLVASQEFGGGIKTFGLAVLRGRFTRDDGTQDPALHGLELIWPVTAIEIEGNYYPVVAMAQEQGVPIGLRFLSGEENLGEIVLPETFDPNQQGLSLLGADGQAVHDGLMTGKDLKVQLIAGGQVFSTIEVEGEDYKALVDSTVLPTMSDMQAKEDNEGCYVDGVYVPSCFLTTAACSVVGLSDDCWELTQLRRFRDGFMAGFAEGRADIERYYRNAPAVAERLMASATGRARLLKLYWTVIMPCAVMARLGLNRAAYRRYRTMMVDLGA